MGLSHVERRQFQGTSLNELRFKPLQCVSSGLPTLLDSAESFVVVHVKHSFHVLRNKFGNLPDVNIFPVMLNAILGVSLIVAQNLPECKDANVSSSGKLAEGF